MAKKKKRGAAPNNGSNHKKPESTFGAFGDRLSDAVRKVFGEMGMKRGGKDAKSAHPSPQRPVDAKPEPVKQLRSDSEANKRPAEFVPRVTRAGKAIPNEGSAAVALDKQSSSGSGMPSGERRASPPAFRSYHFLPPMTLTDKHVYVEQPRRQVKHAELLRKLRQGVLPVRTDGNNSRVDRMNAFLDRQGSRTRDWMTVNLGVDAGTGFTKVAWRDIGERMSHPIVFGRSGGRLGSMLVPSVITLDGGCATCGTGVNGSSHNDTQRIEHFKMCLGCVGSECDPCGPARCPLTSWAGLLGSEDFDDLPVEVLSAYFLARVLAESRNRVSAELAKTQLDGRVHWSANFAVPVSHLDVDTVLETFNVVVKTAWVMSAALDGLHQRLRTSEIRQCFDEALAFATERELDCFVYPEVGAQVAAATLARSARDGLYGFVDVGAGTVDTTIFRLHSKGGEPEIVSYAADVERLGVAYLKSSAAKFMGRTRRGKTAVDGNASDSVVVSEFGDRVPRTALRAVEKQLDAAFREILKKSYAKEPRPGAWDRLQLIVGGGGSHIPLYAEAAKRAFRRRVANIEVSQLPLPRDFDLEGLPPREFHRFAVAYGLSHEIVRLPDCALPSQVKPLDRTGIAPRPRPEMVSKDLV